MAAGLSACGTVGYAQVGLGNQLKTVNIIEPELRQRFAKRYGFEPDPTKECFVS